jgi:hypothetical protein
MSGLQGNFGYEHFHDPVRVVTTGTSTKQSAPDRIIVVNLLTPAAFSVVLFGSPLEGRRVTVKDGAGNAATYNVTISTSDATTIDGSLTFVLNNNYASVDLCFNGTAWNIL